MPEPETPNSNNITQLSQAENNILDNFWGDVGVKANNPYVESRAYSYDANSTTDQNKNFERYYSHPAYKDLGYNPWADNESLYNEKSSASGDVWRATKSAAKLAWTGFKSPLRSYADIFKGDFSSPDYESADEMKYQNTVGSSSRGGVGGFASNLITNSGYTVGLIGEMAVETIALSALELGSAGAATPLVAARLGKMGKDWGNLTNAFKGIKDVVSTYKDYGAAKAAWQSAKSVGKFINPLENTAELFSTTQKIQDFKSLDNLAKASKTAGAFYRDVQMANLTLSESKLEGASTERDLEEQLLAEYRTNNDGKYPESDELRQIKQTARDAGMKSLAWNVPTIYLTNRITFAPLFKPIEKLIGTALAVGSKFIEKEGKGIIKAGFFDATKASLKPKAILQNTLGYFKGNLSEGVQESAQEIISGTTKDYYKNLYNNSSKQGLDYSVAEQQGSSVWDALSKNVTDQFSGQGFETFASGFLMGGLLKVAGTVVKSPVQAVKEYKAEKSKYETDSLVKLNEMNTNPLTYFGPGILNYANGVESVEGQNNAEETGNQKEWLDFENQNLTSHVMTALETDTFDSIFLPKLNNIKTMDPQAIKDAYGLDGQDVLAKIDKVIDRAQNIKKNYDKWTEKFQNPFNPRNFKKDTPEYNKEAINYASWEAAKKVAVFNESTFERNLDRIQGINNDILAQTNSQNISPNDISILSNPHEIKNELRLLDGQIEVLSDSGLTGDRSTLKEAINKRKNLESFLNNLQGYYVSQFDDTTDNEDLKKAKNEFGKVSVAKLYSSYQSYVKGLASNSSNRNPVNNLNLEKSFQQLLDIHDLKQENIYYTNAINTLANPKGFIDQQNRTNKIFSDLYTTREEDIKKSVINAQSKIENNTILTALYNRGFTLSPKNVKKLLVDKLIPTEVNDINAKQVFNEGDPDRYNQFKEIISNYLNATKPEEDLKKDEIDIISDEAWQIFVDSGEVSDDVIKDIVENIKAGKNSSERITQMMADSDVAAKVEALLKDSVAEVATEKLAPELNIDIISKFDAVKNSSQLEELEKEMIELMAETTLDQRNRLGITSDIIEARLSEKNQELISAVTLDNLNRGNIVSFIDGRKGLIIGKGKDFIKIRDLENPALVYTVPVENLKNTIKTKYSENMTVPKTNATSTEAENVKQNINKDLKFTEQKDELKSIMDEAYADEKKFQQDFINELGCK